MHYRDVRWRASLGLWSPCDARSRHRVRRCRHVLQSCRVPMPSVEGRRGSGGTGNGCAQIAALVGFRRKAAARSSSVSAAIRLERGTAVATLNRYRAYFVCLVQCAAGYRELTDSQRSKLVNMAIDVRDHVRGRMAILLRTPQFLVDMFEMLLTRRTSMNDQQQSSQCIDSGRRAIANEAWDDLRRVNDRLWDLMPAAEQASEELRIYTGIV
jgi:hypothetical protein